MVEVDNCAIPKNASLFGAFLKLLRRASYMGRFDAVSRMQCEWHSVSSTRLVLFDYFYADCPVFSIMNGEGADADARHIIRLPGFSTSIKMMK